MFGLAAEHPAPEEVTTRLIGCNPMRRLACWSVCKACCQWSRVFELGREPASAPVHGLRAFRLADVMRRRGCRRPTR